MLATLPLHVSKPFAPSHCAATVEAACTSKGASAPCFQGRLEAISKGKRVQSLGVYLELACHIRLHRCVCDVCTRFKLQMQ